MQINQITPRYENGVMTTVTIHFTGRIGGISFNGPLSFPAEEFQDFLQPEIAESVVKQKVIDIIINGESEPEGVE